MHKNRVRYTLFVVQGQLNGHPTFLVFLIKHLQDTRLGMPSEPIVGVVPSPLFSTLHESGLPLHEFAMEWSVHVCRARCVLRPLPINEAIFTIVDTIWHNGRDDRVHCIGGEVDLSDVN